MKMYSSNLYWSNTAPFAAIVKDTLLKHGESVMHVDGITADIMAAAVNDVFNFDDFMPVTYMRLRRTKLFTDQELDVLINFLHTELMFHCYVPLTQQVPDWNTKKISIVTDVNKGTIFQFAMPSTED